MAERRQRRADGAVPTDFGQGGRDLGRGRAPSPPSRSGTAERRHAAATNASQLLSRLEHRRHHVGDSLLPFVWTEIHPTPP